MTVDIQNYLAFLDLFEKWNRSINLTAANKRGAITEHLEDSLHVLDRLRDARRVLDVGSGGGFPVVVAAIALPDVRFVALEPVHKKHAFLRTCARELGLANLDALAERLEDHETHDYDVAMSRATFDLADWLRAGAEHVRVGGIVIGFEAHERVDVVGVDRDRYELRGKARSLVIKRC